MKKISFFIVFALVTMGAKSQSLIGAWENSTTSENGDKIKSVVIFSDAYQVITSYNLTTGEFIHSNGGSWKLDGDLMTEKIEFDTNNSERVGTENSFKIKVDENSLELVESGTIFTKIDDGTPGALKGAWLMSSRIRDGKNQVRDTSLPRKTMKILSGTRIQWIAYNTATKQFMGTGGGSYTTLDGEYIENIEFFSRDVNKVGLSLKFKYALLDANWQHMGFSSIGDPINETWSLRQ